MILEQPLDTRYFDARMLADGGQAQVHQLLTLAGESPLEFLALPACLFFRRA